MTAMVLVDFAVEMTWLECVLWYCRRHGQTYHRVSRSEPNKHLLAIKAGLEMENLPDMQMTFEDKINTISDNQCVVPMGATPLRLLVSQVLHPFRGY